MTLFKSKYSTRWGQYLYESKNYKYCSGFDCEESRLIFLRRFMQEWIL